MWFNGETDWGAQLDDFDPPYLLEIGAKRRPTDDERLLLDAPWETLADDRGYWCARQYGPHRRLGKVKASDAGIEQEPLSVLFMAADPNGVQPLGYELEEAAILNATKHAPLDLYVEDTGTASELGEQYRRLPVGHLCVHFFGTIPRGWGGLLLSATAPRRSLPPRRRSPTTSSICMKLPYLTPVSDSR